MDLTPEELEDLAKMRELRLRLRALAETRIALLETLDPPTTWLETNRQLRAINAADRLVVSLYSPLPKRRAPKRPASGAKRPANREPSSPRLALPGLERRAAEAAAEAAATAEMNRTLAAPGRLMSEAAPEAFDVVNKMVHACARWAGIWPDGAPWQDRDADWQTHALTADIRLPEGDIAALPGWMDNLILDRCNAIARHWSRKAGVNLDKSERRDDDPDYWSISANHDTGVNHPAEDEADGPPGLPWWIIRRT